MPDKIIMEVYDTKTKTRGKNKEFTLKLCTVCDMVNPDSHHDIYTLRAITNRVLIARIVPVVRISVVRWRRMTKTIEEAAQLNDEEATVPTAPINGTKVNLRKIFNSNPTMMYIVSIFMIPMPLHTEEPEPVKITAIVCPKRSQ